MISILENGRRHELDGDHVSILPAGTVLVEISPELSAAGVWSGGRLLHGVSASNGATLATLHLARTTGYHELRSGPRIWRFGTQDAKLRIDGVHRMFEFLAEYAPRWSGAVFATGGTECVRDPRLDKAWLDSVAPELLDAAARIAADPEVSSRPDYRRSRSGRPSTPQTVRLLRANPHLLERFEGGPVEIEEDNGSTISFAPREAIVRSTRCSSRTVANRRATTLLSSVRRLALSLSTRSDLPDASKAAVAVLADRVTRVLRNDLYARQHARPRDLFANVSPVEQNDPRYQLTYATARELTRDRAFRPQAELLDSSAYVGYVDQIFQAFCAHVLAEARGLVSVASGTTSVLRFENAEWIIHADVAPPERLLTDWRNTSNRPSSLRPDLVVEHRLTGNCAVLDAKYRTEKIQFEDDSVSYRASSSALSELQVYMQSYDVRSVAVLYPDPTSTQNEVFEVSGAGNRIFEIPISPAAHLQEFAANEIWATIEVLAGIK